MLSNPASKLVWRDRTTAVVVGLAMIVALLMVGLLAPVAHADTTFTVDRSDDPDLGTTPAAGACTEATANDCSLRGAITAANTTPGADTINFQPSLSPATITLVGSQLPAITDSAGLIIDGGSANITVSGNDAVRVFEVGTSTTSGAKLTLNNLTVAKGRAINGGGILNNSSNTLMVNNSTISDNDAVVEGQSGGIGGGIHNSGALTVSNSTISDNNASNAGGIWNDTSNTLTVSTVSNSTVSGNKANHGGGIYTQGTLTVSNSTISNNTGFLGTGGINGDTTSTTLKNTIVANNLGRDGLPSVKDCSEDMTDGGYNLDSDGSCGFTTENNSLSSTDPMLGALADNGGPTRTHALLSGSPAIDAGPPTDGDPTACPPPATDQRGVSRPQDGDADGSARCDIGAFEADIVKPMVSITRPANKTTGIAPTANVTATFTEEMDDSTISGQTFKLFEVGTTTNVTATVSYAATTNKAKLNPASDLSSGATYKAVVTTGAEDLAGNPLDQKPDKEGNQKKSWKFTVQ